MSDGDIGKRSGSGSFQVRGVRQRKATKVLGNGMGQSQGSQRLKVADGVVE